MDLKRININFVPVILYFFKIGLKSIRNFTIFVVVLLIIVVAIFKVPLLYNVIGYRILMF